MPKTKSLPLVVFTDLDGTLLDHHTYSHAAALPALARLESIGIPCIINTSKTVAELLKLREELNNRHPFIAENGAGVAIPADYPIKSSTGLVEKNGLLLKSFGYPRAAILDILEPLHERFKFTGFSQMSSADISRHTGLDDDAARLAGQREFTEPLLWHDSEANFDAFSSLLADHELQCLRGGRFIHIMGRCDKGMAMQWLAQQLPGVTETTRLVALGDSANDIAMLRQADIAVMVKSPVHPPLQLPAAKQLVVTEQEGPAGWNVAITQILDTLDQT